MVGPWLPSLHFSDNNLAFYQQGLLSGRIHCVLLPGTILGRDKDKLSSWKGNGTTSRRDKEESKLWKKQNKTRKPLSLSLPEGRGKYNKMSPFTESTGIKSWSGRSHCSPHPGHMCEGGNLLSAYVPSSAPSLPTSLIPSLTLHST